VFSGSFAPQTGGVPGLFLATNGGLSPYLLRGEMSPGGGRLAAFGRAPSLNASDELACSATVIGGTAQSAILIAPPTVLAPPALAQAEARPRRHRARRGVLRPRRPAARGRAHPRAPVHALARGGRRRRHGGGAVQARTERRALPVGSGPLLHHARSVGHTTD